MTYSSKYLGLIFCRAETQNLVVEIVKKSHRYLMFEVVPSYYAAVPAEEAHSHGA
jgi:hypothetical protein